MRSASASALALFLLAAPAVSSAAPPIVTCDPAGTDALCALTDTLNDIASHAKCTPGAVSDFLRSAVADGALSADDVRGAFAKARETGDKVSECEMAEIRAGLAGGRYTVDDDARKAAIDAAYLANLLPASAKTLKDGKTYGGTEIPDAVKELVAKAKLNGAVLYDVSEENPYTHYPATAPAEENMAFSYTEITPKALADDMALTGPQVKMTGTETLKNSDGSTYENVTYGSMNGGTGSISANYDEAWHENLYARGYSGDKWANNFAILSDGSIHCLPAARRSVLHDVILTNPALSRGQQMMFNGHLDVQHGVVVGVEMSGVLAKRAAKGKDSFIDPIALLKAWGFQLAPDLHVSWGNTSAGAPTRDEDGGVIGAAAVSTASNP